MGHVYFFTCKSNQDFIRFVCCPSSSSSPPSPSPSPTSTTLPARRFGPQLSSGLGAHRAAFFRGPRNAAGTVKSTARVTGRAKIACADGATFLPLPLPLLLLLEAAAVVMAGGNRCKPTKKT